VLLLGFIGLYGYTYFRVKGNLGGGVTLTDLAKEAPKGPLNILVLGSDRRDVVEGSERTEHQFRGGSGQRADTIILVHLFAGSSKAVLISFPRDLRVNIPGHGIDKINAAYPLGGPQLIIKTIKELTGVPINHYIEVNFSSFRGIVNALGGVDLYFPKPVSDRRSGLDITAADLQKNAGCVTLKGDQALSFVRARYIYPNADFGRIQAQQRFIRAMIDKTKSLGTLLNPFKLISISEQIDKGVVHDKDLGLGTARAVAAKLGAAGQGGVDFRIYPGEGELINHISYVVPNELAARRLFDAVRADAPLPPVGKTGQSLPEPADVTVRVINAAGVSGLASQQRAALVAKGYRVYSIGSSPTHTTSTVITYSPGAELKAQLIAKLYPGAKLRVATRDQATDIVLSLGISFTRPAPSGSAAPKPTVPTTISECP
jgi:LCP family protein required for cell wall assembly